jgi:alpha-1,6-mannosyltransferase
MKILKNGIPFNLVSIFFCLSIFIQSYFVERTSSFDLLFFWIVDFISFYLILFKCKADFKQKFNLLVLLHLIPFFALPQLSNDYYRFLWDGELIHSGINPFDFKPNEIIHKELFQKEYYSNLFHGMGALSQENYSCYPVFNQFYFAIATFFSNSILLNTIILRILILATLYLGFYFLKKILVTMQVETSKLFLFFMNPLLIIEVSQNLHFEGVMLSFFIVGIYFLTREKNAKNLLLAALFLSFSIQIKLIPLILLPFLLRYLGWKFSILTWFLSITFTILFSLILIYPSNFVNFWTSILLYFRQFEFNSCILYWYIQYGKSVYGYNRIQTYGPYLGRIATHVVLAFAWFGGSFSLEKMFTRMLFAVFIYFLLSSTVHPWYILTPLLLSVFTNYKFIHFWTFLIGITYLSYSEISNSNLRILIFAEYFLVLLFMSIEIVKYNFTSLKRIRK